MKKYAIVTGASSGFGLLIAIELAKLQFHVLATMREINRGTELLNKAKEEGVSSYIIPSVLDVTCEHSIANFSESLEAYGNIQILVNNAGAAYGGFAEHVKIKEYRQQFETNFFGLIAITQAVLPYMQENNYGKIINISSISGLIGFPGLSPYVASKYALEGFSECLRLEVKPFGIDVIVIEPGSYKTNIWSRGKHISVPEQPSVYDDYLNNILDILEKSQESYGNPAEVADFIKKLVSKNKPSLRYPIGKSVKISILLKKLIPWKQWEKIVYKQVFKK